MADDWVAALVDAVLAGRPPTRGSDELDSLLKWMAGTATPDAEALSAEFARRGTDEAQSHRLALALMDRWLFAHEGCGSPWAVLGLEPGTPRERAQRRYHRLVQIYHPDRARGDPEWLTERTETLNRAWSQIRRRGGGSASADGHQAAQSPSRRPRPGSSRPPQEESGRSDDGTRRHRGRRRASFNRRFDRQAGPGGGLREVLGDSNRLQRRIVGMLLLVAAVILGGGLLATLQPDPLPSTGDVVQAASEELTGSVTDPDTTQAADTPQRVAEIDTKPDDALARYTEAADTDEEVSAEVVPEAAGAPILKTATGVLSDGIDDSPRPPARSEPENDRPASGAELETGSGYVTVVSTAEPRARSETETDAGVKETDGADGDEVEVAAADGESASPVPGNEEQAPDTEPVPGPEDDDPAAAQAATRESGPAPGPDLEEMAALLQRGQQTIARYAEAEDRSAPDALTALLSDPLIVDGTAQQRARYVDARRRLANEALATSFSLELRELEVASAGELVGAADYNRWMMRGDGSIVADGGTLHIRMQQSGNTMRISALEQGHQGYHRERHVRDEVRAVLDHYTVLYAAGDVAPFAALFTEDVSDNTTSGRDAVSDAYRALFDGTATRTLEFDIDRALPSSASSVEVHGTYDVRLEYIDGRTYRKTAPIRIELERTGGEYRISTMAY